MGNRISSTGDTRTVYVGCDSAKNFIDNKIKSSKYTIWNFVPKNLFEQFRRIANFYFLCMALIAFSIDSPIPPVTSLLPLVFVVVVTAFKQGYEDYLRHKSDRDVNNAQVAVVRQGKELQIEAKKIKVGDLVKLEDNQDVPCDVILLLSDNNDGKCYVTTANLDGETNLKTILCPKSLRSVTTTEELMKLEAKIECEKPTPDLYKFNGRIEFNEKVSPMIRQSLQTDLERRLTIRSSIGSPGNSNHQSMYTTPTIGSRGSSFYQSKVEALNEFGDQQSNLTLDQIKDAFKRNSYKESEGEGKCCGEGCGECVFRVKNENEASDDQEQVVELRRKCPCRCRSRKDDPDPRSDDSSSEESGSDEGERKLKDAEQVLKKLEEKMMGLEEVSRYTKSEEDVVSNFKSEQELGSCGEGKNFALPKINSTPEISQSDGVPRALMHKSAMMKHRKTESNASHVSFNVDRSVLRRKSSFWPLERKVSLISQRKSSLLSSRKPSLVSAEGALADPLSAENLLLRGSRIKNTKFVYGCAVYTGLDTKLALNSKLTSNKFSTVERTVNKFLIFFLVFLLIEVVVSTALKVVIETRSNYRNLTSYIQPRDEVLETNFSTVVRDFFSFFVLYNYIIPISLYVTIELQKFLGTLFFEWDQKMFDEETKQGAICNTSDLNEELGQIEYLFSDKTGTLTENNMEFRRCSVNGVGYFEKDGYLHQLPRDGTESVLTSPVDFANLETEMEHFLLALTLCHTVQIQENTDEDGNLLYTASSPDEKALVEAMRKLGAVYTGDEDELIVVELFGDEKIFRKLELLEFTSDRKRMSIIVEDEQGQIWLYCKGAESAVLSLVTQGPTEETLASVADFAVRGLRTLVIGYKKLTQNEYKSLSIQMQKARQTLSSNRDQVVAQVYKKVEGGLTVLGSTGVEDQLQEGVQETLESLRAAGIKVWILTGDKVETAVNISLSCGHMKPGTTRLELVGVRTHHACSKLLKAHESTMKEHNSYALVVDGESLAIALKNEKELFREVCCKCTSVICCRMSPLQKSEVVHLIKTSSSRPITAAIGDGANDVSMIQEAHVGLGIMGKEGRQAVRCSDFAFAKFKFAREALLVHGHWYYMRISILVQYFFYKNIVFITPQLYFMFLSLFSTQALYDTLYLTCYNLFFTSLPILIYGLFEQDYSADELKKYPQLYQIYARNGLMTWTCFAKWILYGVWDSVVIFGLVTLFYISNSSFLNWGRDSDLVTYGSTIFHCVVYVVNFKLCLHSRYWSIVFIGSVIISIVGFTLLAVIYSVINLPTSDTANYFAYLKLLASLNFWLLSIMIIVVCLVPDLLFKTISENWTTWRKNWKKNKLVKRVSSYSQDGVSPLSYSMKEQNVVHRVDEHEDKHMDTSLGKQDGVKSLSFSMNEHVTVHRVDEREDISNDTSFAGQNGAGVLSRTTSNYDNLGSLNNFNDNNVLPKENLV